MDLASLNAAITAEELLTIIKGLTLHKSPGPDSLPYFYYKTFFDILSPHTLTLYDSLLKGISPHSQFSHLYISVIPKPGKDPSIPYNYSPIALLNSDYKIFTKILVSRLSRLIPKLIHSDQVGFVPGRHAGENTRRTVDLIDLLDKSSRSALVLSLDAQKAFDRLSWPYMFATLKTYGFNGPFLKALEDLYSTVTSQVQMSSFLSPGFPMTNGTRQGCPLSPLLFILCLEPMAESIRTHPDICGVVMRQGEYKLSLFADDILLTITNPLISLPSLQKLLSSFSAISGDKINNSKTEALPIHIPPSMSQLKDSYPYKWCTTSLKYLGIILTPSYSSLYHVNYPPLVLDINKSVTTWTKYPLSLSGRINVLKMTILPRLLYHFETLPVATPSSQLKTFQRSFLKFI